MAARTREARGADRADRDVECCGDLVVPKVRPREQQQDLSFFRTQRGQGCGKRRSPRPTASTPLVQIFVCTRPADSRGSGAGSRPAVADARSAPVPPGQIRCDPRNSHGRASGAVWS